MKLLTARERGEKRGEERGRETGCITRQYAKQSPLSKPRVQAADQPGNAILGQYTNVPHYKAMALFVTLMVPNFKINVYIGPGLCSKNFKSLGRLVEKKLKIGDPIIRPPKYLPIQHACMCGYKVIQCCLPHPH